MHALTYLLTYFLTHLLITYCTDLRAYLRYRLTNEVPELLALIESSTHSMFEDTSLMDK